MLNGLHEQEGMYYAMYRFRPDTQGHLAVPKEKGVSGELYRKALFFMVAELTQELGER